MTRTSTIPHQGSKNNLHDNITRRMAGIVGLLVDNIPDILTVDTILVAIVEGIDTMVVAVARDLLTLVIGLVRQ